MYIIAHRGASHHAPENTLPAIQKALNEKMEAIEIDVRLTKDHTLVLMHDGTLDRTTNGEGNVADTTWSNIRQLDAGAWFHSNFKDTHVPRLEDVLKLMKHSTKELHIEIKRTNPYDPIEQEVISLIHKYQMGEQVLLTSFQPESLMRCKQMAPQIRRGLITIFTPSPALLQAIQDLDVYSIHPHVALLTKEIHLFQANGFKIFPFVVTKKSELHMCLQYRTDGFYTNRPSEAK
jgi:glycerophosphoryl diester phosphodiesterase